MEPVLRSLRDVKLEHFRRRRGERPLERGRGAHEGPPQVVLSSGWILFDLGANLAVVPFNTCWCRSSALIRRGFYGDSATTVAVAPVDTEIERLLRTTEESLQLAIDQCRVGKRVGDISHAVQTHVEANGCTVVREYCGHGIGREFHEDPQVLHYGTRATGAELHAGMVFTIEPMVNAGKRHVRLLPDGWTVVTKDHSLSAQWEHTLLVTDSGYEVFTLGAEDRK